MLRNMALAVLACLLCNGLIFALGWQGSTDDAARQPGALAPPGWVIGTVWVGLFAAMGAARALLEQQMADGWLRDGRAALEALRARRLLDLLLVNCLAYPAYTLGLSNRPLTLAGNALTILLAVIVIRAAWPASRRAVALVAPVIAWVSFASVAVLRAAGVV